MNLKKIILFFACFYGIYCFCTAKTDGFAFCKIYSEIENNSMWDVPQQEMTTKLNQPYYYLGRGTQNYAFISNDGLYVLKFFRHERASHPLKPYAFLFPSHLKNRLLKTVEKRKLRRLKSYNSYKLAFDNLRKEAGLISIHLNKSNNLGISVDLYDKIGIFHKVDLDSVSFILQKKADPFYPTLEKWIASRDLQSAQRGIKETVSLLKERCIKELFDKDPDLETNFGFIDGHPIQIDIGRFSPDPTRSDPDIYVEDLIRITDHLKQWLGSRAPHLSEYLYQEIQSLK